MGEIVSQQVTVSPSEIDLEALGKNGIRIKYQSRHEFSIEVKNQDNWEPMKYVRSIDLHFDAESPPIVTINYYIIS